MLRKKISLYKILVLISLLAVVFAKSSMVIHGYSHNAEISIEIIEDKNDEIADCYLCEFADVSSKILMGLALVIVAFADYFLRILSRLSKLKLTYFISSKLSRGPPLVI